MPKSIVARAQEIILNPAEAWAEIDTEPADIQAIYRGYIAPLAAIPAVATFIGTSLFGYGTLGTRLQVPIVAGVVRALVHYALLLVSVYVFAWIIDWLAPKFGAQRNFGQAFKVSAYSATASWLAGIFHIIPALDVLAVIGGLYSLYLVFVGLPALMKPPQDKATMYTVASIGTAIALTIIVAAALGEMFAVRGGLL